MRWRVHRPSAPSLISGVSNSRPCESPPRAARPRPPPAGLRRGRAPARCPSGTSSRPSIIAPGARQVAHDHLVAVVLVDHADACGTACGVRRGACRARRARTSSRRSASRLEHLVAASPRFEIDEALDVARAELARSAASSSIASTPSAVVSMLQRFGQADDRGDDRGVVGLVRLGRAARRSSGRS